MQKYLEEMNDEEYKHFCLEIINLEFLSHSLSMSYDEDSTEIFLKYFFINIMIDSIRSPLQRALLDHQLILNEKNPSKRWEHFSRASMDKYMKFKKCKFHKDDKNPWKDYTKFYNKYYSKLTGELL